MVNEEIVGGLISALSRSDSLEKGMMTFYNAGYEKDEIEDAAKVVYSQLGAQAMGINGSLQDTLNAIAVKAGVITKPKPSTPDISQKREASPEEMRLQLQKKSPELNPVKPVEQAQQNVSAYGDSKVSNGPGTNADQLMEKIQNAIKEMKPVSIPPKIEIINKNIDASDKNEKRVSDYKEDNSKPISKMLTYVLVFILLLLLGLLGAVFFFKDELIKIFNNAGLA